VSDQRPKPAPAEADSLVLTLARIIVAIERRRRLVVIDGGKPMAGKVQE